MDGCERAAVAGEWGAQVRSCSSFDRLGAEEEGGAEEEEEEEEEEETGVSGAVGFLPPPPPPEEGSAFEVSWKKAASTSLSACMASRTSLAFVSNFLLLNGNRVFLHT